MTRLVLTMSGQADRRYLPFLKKHLRQAHALLRPPLRELSIALVDNRTMSSLHRRHLKLFGPTDVLTFPMDLDSRGRALSGEVVICAPEARRRAKLERSTIARELLLYALHGMLHLCGHDDRTDRDFNRMHQMEDKILMQLGVGPVFAHPTARFAAARRSAPARASGHGAKPVRRVRARRSR